MDRKQYFQEYRKKNREKLRKQNREYMKERRNNPETKDIMLKNDTINKWKNVRKLKGNLEEVYDICLNTKECYICNKELIHNTSGGNKVCMDHNHITGYFRNVLCNKCNSQRGYIDRNYINVINELKFYFKPLPNVLTTLQQLRHSD